MERAWRKLGNCDWLAISQADAQVEASSMRGSSGTAAVTRLAKHDFKASPKHGSESWHLSGADVLAELERLARSLPAGKYRHELCKDMIETAYAEDTDLDMIDHRRSATNAEYIEGP